MKPNQQVLPYSDNEIEMPYMERKHTTQTTGIKHKIQTTALTSRQQITPTTKKLIASIRHTPEADVGLLSRAVGVGRAHKHF